MKTLKDVNTLIDHDVNQYRETRSALLKDLRDLEQIYRDALGTSALFCVLKAADELGAERTKILLASLTNYSAWDGRISRANAKWAESVPESWDGSACQRMSVYTNVIHKTHLDQMVTAMRRMETEGKA